MRTVLVPLDGSEFAEQALAAAADIARHWGASLHLVAVYEPQLLARPASTGAPPMDHGLDPAPRSRLRSYLEDARRRVRAMPGAPTVVTLVLDGRPADTLAEHARRSPPDLLVLATHGRGGVSRWWLGSVADELVRRVACPILAVRPRAEAAAPDTAAPPAAAGFRRLLVALDATPDGEAAIEPAVLLGAAAPHGVTPEYALLHVVSPNQSVIRAITYAEEAERTLVEEQREVQDYLSQLAARLRTRGLHVHTVVREETNAAAAITAQAAEMGADVVVLATHGRGPVNRLLLGSVADKVLRTSPVPVLLCAVSGAAQFTEPLPPPAVARTTARTPAPAPAVATLRAAGAPHGGARADAGEPRRIVAAVDFAPSSRRAAEWVACRFPDAELVLAHVLDIPEPPTFLASSIPVRTTLVEDALRTAELRLRELAHTLPSARVWTEVRVGNPVVAIHEVARAYDADLLVVGEHGARPEETNVSGRDSADGVGSTAARLARVAGTPLLLARGLSDEPPRRILGAIDDSGCAAPLLTWTRSLARRFGSDVVLLHVLDPALAGVAAPGSTAERDSLMAALRESTAHWLERRAEELAPGTDRVTTEVGVGDVPSEILRARQERGADLVVLGVRHARDGSLVPGGRTVDRLLSRGTGPLLVVPEPG